MAEEDSGVRQLTLSASRVEVRLYRRTRTSADRIPKPAHFQFILRCDWSGQRREDLEFGSELDMMSQYYGQSCWWDPLPSTYTVKRKWVDIQRFHHLVDNELSFDQQGGYRRIKGRMPNLPEAGDLDKFVKSLAATGDVMALNRKRDPEQQGDSFDDLDELHAIFVENRLTPYFAEVNKVLAELPWELLQASAALRNFVTSGSSCRVKPPDHGIVSQKNKFFGPGPQMLEPHDLAAGARKLRRQLAISASHDEGKKGGKAETPAAPAPKKKTAPAKPPPDTRTSGAEGAEGAEEGEGEMYRTVSESDMRLTKREEARQRRMASSHYGFFAHSLSNKDMASSGRDFWKRMVAKERREIGRRTMLIPSDDGSSPRISSSHSASRLPALPTSGSGHFSSQVRTQVQGQKLSKGPSKEALNPPAVATTKNVDMKAEHMEVALRDVMDGLRISILGAPLSQVPRSIRLQEPMPLHPLPGREETMKVYRLYCNLLEMEGSTAAGDQHPKEADVENGTENADQKQSEVENQDTRLPEKRRGAEGKEVKRIAWSTMIGWAQHMEDLAEDFRYRSVTAALNRALQLFRKTQASPAQRKAGVSLAMLFQWIWPNMDEEHMCKIMYWVCMSEIDKFRQPTPRLIEPGDRRALESIFHAMDVKGLGSCSAEDIAGGKAEDVTNKLKNIVDAETVKAVIGQERIGLLPFLELMCENDYLAHEGAKQVLKSDGRKIVLQDRKAVDIKIWVLEGLPPEEENARQLADVFEAEILRWSSLAASKKAAALQERKRLEGQAGQGELDEDFDEEDDYHQT